MRPVQVYKHALCPLTNKWKDVMDGVATFHMFGMSFDELQTEVVHYPVAVIERPDGRVEVVPAHKIQFLDGRTGDQS